MKEKDLKATGKSLVDLNKALGMLHDKFDLKSEVVEIERVVENYVVGPIILWKITAEIL